MNYRPNNKNYNQQQQSHQSQQEQNNTIPKTVTSATNNNTNIVLGMAPRSNNNTSNNHNNDYMKMNVYEMNHTNNNNNYDMLEYNNNNNKKEKETDKLLMNDNDNNNNNSNNDLSETTTIATSSDVGIDLSSSKTVLSSRGNNNKKNNNNLKSRRGTVFETNNDVELFKSCNHGISDTSSSGGIMTTQPLLSATNNNNANNNNNINTNNNNNASVISIDKNTLTSASTMNTNNNNSSSANTNNNNLSGTAGTSATTATATTNLTAAFQLLFGAAGIFIMYLYYGLVQEDLFRYRDPISGDTFTYVWYLQMAESSVTILIGYLGKQYYMTRTQNQQQQQMIQKTITHPIINNNNNNNSIQQITQTQNIPTFLFFQSGTSQLLGKAFMAMSLSAGLSFPVVVLAKSAKVVPVMLGQFILGGSNYKYRDYIFALLIVSGTAMLSFGSTIHDGDEEGGGGGNNSSSSSKNTGLGLILIFLSLVMDGITGGLQKKLKQETKHIINISTYDFLFYSHTAMFTVAAMISISTGEFIRGHVFLLQHISDGVVYLLLASCFCSAIGQCFIFYVIATFDPLVCTTVTTTRKMVSVLFSICFKGHHLSIQGIFGLLLGITALFIEVEGQFNKHNNSNNNNKQSSLPTQNKPTHQSGGINKKLVTITPSPSIVNLNNYNNHIIENNNTMTMQQRNNHQYHHSASIV